MRNDHDAAAIASSAIGSPLAAQLATRAADRPSAANIPPNCLHAAFRAVQQWEQATRRRAIGLHVGEPGFAPPPAAVEALAAAARDQRTAYTSAEGMPELRDALTAKLAERTGLRTIPERVFVCPGSCQGLAAVLLSLASPGSEVLLPELHWPIHLQQVLLAGMRPRFYPLSSTFLPEAAAVAAAATPQTRVLLINSPANPTGAVIDAATARGLLELARVRAWQVISDEAYEDFVYEGEMTSIGALEQDEPEASRRVYSTFSFSKGYAMTGYRLGYVVAPNAKAASVLQAVQEASIIAPSTPVQHAGLAALAAPDELKHNHAHVADIFRSALPELADANLLRCLPRGGWYTLVDLGPGVDADAFASVLLREQGVGVATGRGFTAPPALAGPSRRPVQPTGSSLLRLSLCGHQDDVRRGVERLISLARECQAGRDLLAAGDSGPSGVATGPRKAK